MSTVETFQGVGANTKLSSRVLAPPGGKCSDLFGPTEDVDSKKKGYGNSSDPFRAEVNTTPLRNRQDPDTKHRLGLGEGQAVYAQPDELVKEGAETVKEQNEQNKENVNDDAEKEKVEEKAEEAPKKRIPPGGFSSKLW